MKKLMWILLMLPLLTNAQQQGLTVYEAAPSGSSMIAQDSVFVPIKQGNRTVYAVFAFGNAQASRTFDPGMDAPITLEGDYMYAHLDERLAKYNRFTMKEIWSAQYGSSEMKPQWRPDILNEKYVAATVDDHIVLVEKESGKLLLDIKGKDFEDGISLSDNYLICTNGDGKTWAVDIATGKEAWSIDVGETAGYGNVTDNGNIYLPSWDPKFFCLDQKTGKKKWVLDLQKYKNGCGSGFEETPVLKGGKLYAVHRDHGLFVIDKNTGTVLENKEEFGEIVDNVILYQDKYLLFIDTDNLYVYAIAENRVHKQVALPFKMRTGLVQDGNRLVATQVHEWKDQPYKKGVVSFDLEVLLGE